ncbi:MAG: DJ-1/PfpI family protein [Bacteroidia bacterium]|nr:DJ-1/PfpI family protein [Bacteroidia bacterium]
MKQIAVLLFNDFETLDAFGPVEILGRIKSVYSVAFYSLQGGHVTNSHGISILTQKLDEIPPNPEIFLIPGGLGTRKEITNAALIHKIKSIAQQSNFVLTVCTGSALLAASGLLDHKSATSNKRAFDWVMSTSNQVNWIKNARWTVDGNFYTSSGVSAGMDMTLGFLADQHGVDFARSIATEIEYHWNEDEDRDDFSEQ